MDKPVLMHDLPSKCETCEEKGLLEPLLKILKAAFGETTLVIGYTCHACGTGHLYR